MKNWGINIGVIITLLSLLIGGITKFNSIQAKTEETSIKITVIEEKVEKLQEEKKEEIEELKNSDIATNQTITEFKVNQAYIKENLEDLNENLKELIKEIRTEKEKKK